MLRLFERFFVKELIDSLQLTQNNDLCSGTKLP